MHADFQPCAYITASARYGTLYTGVTSHLIQRICQPQRATLEGLTNRRPQLPTDAVRDELVTLGLVVKHGAKWD